ncbi:hypothetical protein [Shewanella ulleungensis]|jgi:hypothetical protein|uniref:hypothetical protein n=1 Tax=Shewanella ulleungensis TaxID=2282699 RepID=UPI003D7A2FD2
MLGLLILALLTVVPVRIGAQLFDADNKGLGYCLLAVVIGTTLATACTALIGGLTGLILAYFLVSIVYSKIFLLSFGSALFFTLAVFLIQVGLTQALTDLGIFILNSRFAV